MTHDTTHHLLTKVPYGYCQCGCGQKTSLATHDDKASGAIKGKPRRYLKNHDKSRPLVDKFWEKVTSGAPDECWLWNGAKTRLGYGSIGDGGRTRSAHRVAWELSFGAIPEDMSVCHHCDNPACVNPAHLFLGSRTDNMQDKTAKGRGNHPKGSKSGSAKLTEDQVVLIRELSETGMSYYRIGKMFGISDITAARIVKREIWKHVP